MKPNPRMKYVWISLFLFLSQIVILGLVITLDMFDISIVDGFPNSLALGIPLEVVVITVSSLLTIFLYKYYSTFEVDFEKDHLSIRKGLFTVREFTIPYNSIKSIKIVRKGIHFFDQIFGLSTLSISTKSAVYYIPGLSKPDHFIKKLSAAMNQNETLMNSDLYLTDHELLLKALKRLYSLDDRLDDLEAKVKDIRVIQRQQLLLPKPKEDKELINISTKTKRRSKKR